MNDTPRDELIERIAELADQFACGAAGEPVVYALHGPMDFAEEVIALVTAARDAEIREALLSERTAQRVEATVSYMDGYRDHDIADGVIGTALDAIGLGDSAVPKPDAADANATATDAVERVKAAIRGVLKSAWEDDDEKLIYPCDIDAMAHAAIAAVPTVQDTVGDNLDAMLDSVHPEATLSLHHISMPMADDPDPYWCAQVRIPITGFVGNRMYESTGATRREAVLGAVAKAKEATQ